MIQDKKIIFLTYLTNYNIKDIYHAFSFNKTDDFIEDYLKVRRESNQPISDAFVESTRLQSKERYEEMVYAGINFISWFDNDFPKPLKKIYQCPPLLYVKGKIKNKTNVAIVGTRDMSEFATGKIEAFVDGLTSEFGIISGLAVGIDTVAHKAALTKKIYTAAVLANSLDHVYPKENYRLANEIIANDGALISELPIGLNRGKKSFVERNRLQSGLSEFVFPVEMGVKSGTMHTVEFCIRQRKFLLLNKVDKKLKNLTQYEGINSLLKREYEKTIRFPDIISGSELLKLIQPTINPTLF